MKISDNVYNYALQIKYGMVIYVFAWMECKILTGFVNNSLFVEIIRLILMDNVNVYITIIDSRMVFVFHALLVIDGALF
jgi:hypothetical protein